VPTFIYPARTWKSPWKGYTIDEKPCDVDSNDLNVSLERDMWMKYSLPGRLIQSKITYGIISLGHSHLWDIHGCGQSYISNIDQSILAISNDQMDHEDILIHEI